MFGAEAMQGKDPSHPTMNDARVPAGNSRRRFFDTRYWLRDLILSLLLAFIVIFFLYQPVQVEGTSMMPRLANDERILINKFVYRFEPIQRGDIVVFWYPLDPSKSYIKRVVGLPGERVSVAEGRVYINGQPLRESYLPAEYFDRQSYPVTLVEANHYYVLGDHRESSNDSRLWGTVDRKYIYGKAVFVYWPFSQVGPVE
jgi:signal peptidase I